MGRRKVSMGLIPGRAARISRFGKRKAGLMKKAEELSVLCGVDVALVVAAADGDGGDGSTSAAAADVWESRAGVLARYRALSPEVRARHTHRAYLDAELGKEEAKLARVRQGGPAGLDGWDKALDAGVTTADEAGQLLDALDAALRAADDRRAALGMPPIDGEDDGGGAGVAPLGLAAAGDGAYLLQHAPGDASGDQATAMWGATNGLDMQMQMQPGGGYGFQQCNCGNGCAGTDGYHMQMATDMYGASSSTNNGRLATEQYQHHPRDGYGFQGARASYFGAPSAGGYQMPPQAPGWGTAQPNPRAIVPVDYYPSAEPGLNNYMAAPEAYGAQGGGGGMSFTTGNFINNAPPALSLAMGTGGNFISNAPPAAASSHTMMGSTGDNFTNPTPAQPLAMMSYGGDLTLTNAGRYATPQWQAAQQPQRAGSHQQSSFEQLHYLSDLEETQLNLWGN